MDASKVIAAMAANPGDVWDYISGGTGKGLSLVNDPLPIVLITTTAGTGTEADACGVADLKMSGYGIRKEELPRIARQARITNPFLFTADPATLTDEDVAGILEDAWR